MPTPYDITHQTIKAMYDQGLVRFAHPETKEPVPFDHALVQDLINKLSTDLYTDVVDTFNQHRALETSVDKIEE